MTEIDRLVVIGLVGALFVLIDWYSFQSNRNR